jgi:hypothetical protein
MVEYLPGMYEALGLIPNTSSKSQCSYILFFLNTAIPVSGGREEVEI